MKERPILFSGPMVRAILEGRKTQTRRVVNPQPDEVYERSQDTLLVWGEEARSVSVQCPYGRPGDRLWVRETWCDLRGGGFGTPAAYRADGLNRYGEEDIDSKQAREAYGYKWRPSIHMPRWASRLTLEVTGVRVERLQDITPEDARAEGHPHVPGTERYPQEVHDEAARDWFMDLWDDINAKRGHTWVSNPWVWVVEFKRLEGES